VSPTKSSLLNSSSEDRSPERSPPKGILKGGILKSSSEDRSPERSPPKGILKSPQDGRSRSVVPAPSKKAGRIIRLSIVSSFCYVMREKVRRKLKNSGSRHKFQDQEHLGVIHFCCLVFCFMCIFGFCCVA